MTLTATKKKIAILSMISAVALIMAEVLVFRSGWHILFTRPATSGCNCASVSGIGLGEGLLLGFGALFIVGAIWGVISTLRIVFKTRARLKVLTSAQILPNGLVVFNGGSCEAFTFGMLRPRIALCAHCQEMLPAEEVAAMLAHEKQHVRAYDPLGFLLMDVARAWFFFMPIFGQLARWYRAAAELDADASVENRKALGNALLRVASSRRKIAHDFYAAAISPFASQIEERIEYLIDPQRAPRRKVHYVHLLVSLLVIGGAVGSLYVHSFPSQEVVLRCAGAQLQPSPCQRAFDASSYKYYNGSHY